MCVDILPALASLHELQSACPGPGTVRAAVLSGRWEETLEHTRDAMARDRRTEWRWTPPECLAELKTLADEEDELTQASTKKQTKTTAA